MFKKLLTTMLVLAIVVTAGSAVAGGDYTIYGKLHTSLNMLNNGDTSQLGMTSNTSRFGIKGANELNDNFTFIWQFESKLQMTNQEGTLLAKRNSYVGFKHATAGQVRMGIHDTPFKTLGRKVEIFSDELGDFRTLSSRGPAYSIMDDSIDPSEFRFTKWDNRLPQILAWVSPDWSGFALFLAYQMDTGDKLDYMEMDGGKKYSSMTAFSGMASYHKDEIFVGAAYEKLSEAYAANYDMFTDAGAYSSTTYSDAPAAVRLAGKYTAEKFQFGFIYQGIYQQALDQDTAGNPIFIDAASSMFGVNGKFMAAPKWAIKGGFYSLNEWTDGEDDTDTTDIDEGDWTATMIAIGVDHIVNKNVKVYAQFATVSNGDMTDIHLGGTQSGFGGMVSGAPKLDGDGDPIGTFENPSGFSTGVAFTW